MIINDLRKIIIREIIKILTWRGDQMEISRILSFLKKQSDYVSYDQLRTALNIDPNKVDEFEQVLKEGLDKCWINEYRPTPNVRLYRITNNLLPPSPEDTLRTPYEHYELQGISQYPPSWMNPHISKLVRRNQSGRSICVGCATAYGRDIEQLQNGKSPSLIPSDVGKYVNEIFNGTLIVRDLHLAYGSTSAECVYAWSRELGNVPSHLSGSYLSSAVEAMRKRGIVMENEWYTPLYYSGGEVFPPYPLDPVSVMTKAQSMRVEGYAAIRDFEAVKSAIYTYGYVLMPINIYSNYTEGVSGPLPDPAGSLIGSHALVWIGYDPDRLYFLHSWENWSYIGSISKTYWERAAGTAYAIISANEKEDLAKTYASIYFSSNIACDYYINGVKVINQPISVEVGTSNVFKSVPRDSKYPEKEQVKAFSSEGKKIISFDYTLHYKMNLLPAHLEKMIRDLIKRIRS